MFWFTILLVLITYPIIFAGSCALLLLMAIFSDSFTANPFVSPLRVYTDYREHFTKWKLAIIKWYKQESSKE